MVLKPLNVANSIFTYVNDVVDDKTLHVDLGKWLALAFTAMLLLGGVLMWVDTADRELRDGIANVARQNEKYMAEITAQRSQVVQDMVQRLSKIEATLNAERTAQVFFNNATLESLKELERELVAVRVQVQAYRLTQPRKTTGAPQKP